MTYERHYQIRSADNKIKNSLKEKLKERFPGKAVRVKWNNGRYLIFIEDMPHMISHEEDENSHTIRAYGIAWGEVLFTIPRLTV